MPKRKTADATIAEVLPAAEKNTRAASSRTKSAGSATHKRTATKKAVANPVPEEIAATPVVSFAAPSHEAIAKLAYSYWEQRGYQHGSPQEDWLRAERELVKLSQDR